jgi:hypothetical protein
VIINLGGYIMPDAKTYLGEELKQKEPQKIISHFTIASLNKDDNVLAVFGSTSFIGVNSCVLSTEDRLIYMNNSSLAAKKVIMLYSNITDVELVPENNCIFIYIAHKAERIKVDIKAQKEDTIKLFNFIKGYKDTGASLINEKVKNDKEYAKKIDALNTNTSLKSIGISQHWNEKINKTVLNTPYSKFNLNYCTGLHESIKPCASEVLVEAVEQNVKITLYNANTINIPLHNIMESTIRTEVPIPQFDIKNEYLFFIDIRFNLNNIEYLLEFSRFQNQDVHFESIFQLDYIFHNIEELTRNHQNLIDMRSRENQNIDRLALERQEILKERADTINQMKEMLHPGSNPNTNSQQTAQSPQPIIPPTTTIAPTNFDEIKKFKDLLDSGIITQEEFDTKKKQLLGL